MGLKCINTLLLIFFGNINMGVIKGMYRINSLTQRVDLIKLKISFVKKMGRRIFQQNKKRVLLKLVYMKLPLLLLLLLLISEL